MRKDHMVVAKRAVWVFAASYYEINKWIEFQDLVQIGWEQVLRVLPKWRKRKGGQKLFTYLYGRLQLKGRQMYRNHVRRMQAEGRMDPPSDVSGALEVEELSRQLYQRVSSQLPASDQALLATMLFPSPRFLRQVRVTDRTALRRTDITNSHYAAYLGMSVWSVNRKVSTLHKMIKDSINE